MMRVCVQCVRGRTLANGCQKYGQNWLSMPSYRDRSQKPACIARSRQPCCGPTIRPTLTALLHTPCTICAARLAVARLACKGRLQHFERVSRQSVVVPSASGQRKTRLALRGQTRMQAKGGYSSSRS
jgi:hypothetical protein